MEKEKEGDIYKNHLLYYKGPYGEWNKGINYSIKKTLYGERIHVDQEGEISYTYDNNNVLIEIETKLLGGGKKIVEPMNVGLYNPTLDGYKEYPNDLGEKDVGKQYIRETTVYNGIRSNYTSVIYFYNDAAANKKM